eukprot:350137-Chlamydomonas_euryale.AAC.3
MEEEDRLYARRVRQGNGGGSGLGEKAQASRGRPRGAGEQRQAKRGMQQGCQGPGAGPKTPAPYFTRPTPLRAAVASAAPAARCAPAAPPWPPPARTPAE